MDHTDGRAAAAPEIPSAHRRSAGALPDDSTLVARLRDRDEDTFTHLVDTWTPTMMHRRRTRVSTAESAAEVVQDTWLAVLTRIDRFEARSSLRTWVFRILLNKATTRGARGHAPCPGAPRRRRRWADGRPGQVPRRIASTPATGAASAPVAEP